MADEAYAESPHRNIISRQMTQFKHPPPEERVTCTAIKCDVVQTETVRDQTCALC